MDINVSKENIQSLLDGCMEYINTNINSIDLTEENKVKLEKINKIILNGDGTKILSDNGNYIELDVDTLNSIYQDIQAVWDLFNISISLDKWETKAIIPNNNKATYLTVAPSSTGQIYAIGGNISGGSSNYLSDNCCYDIATNTWSTKAGMLTERAYLTSQSYENKIYVIGGYNGKYLNINQCYDILTDTWSTKAPMINKRYSLTSAIYNGKIYINGGDSPNGVLNINECYDISTNTWSTKADMITKRFALTSVAHNNKVYCIGGYNSSIEMQINECYDIETDTWSGKLNLPTVIYYSTSQVYKNKIYVISGRDSITVRNHNYCYDINSNTWSSKISIPTARYGLGSSIYKNKIYCIGGYYINKNEVYSIEDTTYDLVLPSSIQDKLDIIKNNGDGTKVLSDNGSYIDATKAFIQVMTEEQVTALINEINNM